MYFRKLLIWCYKMHYLEEHMQVFQVHLFQYYYIISKYSF